MAVRKAGVAELLRQAGADAKKTIRQSKTDTQSSSDGIFDILSYIESDWGLGMTLFPAQRAIVKLYYHLELDDKLPEDPWKQIQIRDVLTEEVRYTLTEKEYLSFLHNEGRCNIGEQDHERRELLLSIGRRAGKCVAGNTLVLTDKGIRPIVDLGSAEEEGFSPLEVGVAQEGATRSMSSHFYNGGVKPTFKVKSASGYTVTGTGNHRVRVMTPAGVVDWKYLDDIQPGDYLAIHRGTNLWATEYLDVRPFHNEDGRKELDLPDRLDEDWGSLLGYLVGDGSWRNSCGVAVTVEHKETWSYLKGLFTKLFGSWRVQPDRRTACTGRLEYAGVRARRFLDALGWSLEGDRYGKRVPWSIMQSPRSVVCAFLRGLFETDGCAESGGRHVTFSTASPSLAHDVQVLLLNLGIVSNVSLKWNAKTQRHYAILSIKGVRSRALFAEHIGFDSAKKQKPLLAALARAQEGKSDTEAVPHQYRHIRDLLEAVPKRQPRREKGWGRTKLRVAFGNSCKPGSRENLSYTRLREALGVAEALGVSARHQEHFRRLLEADYFYDPVAGVSQGEEPVYDLTVPDGESFVANGLVNHNTTLSGIFASYEVYRLLNLHNPQEYYGLPNGNRIQIISVATDKDQAGLLFNEVAGHLAKCEYFKPYQANNTQSQVNFRTPYDIEKFGNVYRENGKFSSFNGKASIRLTFRGATGKGLRGAGNIVIILDEFAHFLDVGPASAEEIYKAVTPSAAAFSPKDPDNPMKAIGSKESRIICISSPLGKHGKFYALYDQAMRGGKGSDNMLAIQAPTWEINPTVPLSDLQQAYYADPKAFSVEYGAEFNDQVSGWIEREEDLLACIDPNHRPVFRARPRTPHQMGIDVGLVGDGTFIAITHIEDGKIVLDYHEGWYAGVDWRDTNPHLDGKYPTDYAKTLKTVERLDFDEISKWIQVISKRFHIRDGLFDSWNGIPLEQSLHKKGLDQFKSEHFTQDASSKIYQAAKMMMFDEALVLYDFPVPKTNTETGGGSKHAPYISELLSLRAKRLSKNIVRVEAPQKEGAHDDFSDALVRSIWLSVRQLGSEKYASHGYGGNARPHASSGATSKTFQMRRMRQHGLPPRMVPGRYRR
jgi:intein/homing endonuclease